MKHHFIFIITIIFISIIIISIYSCTSVMLTKINKKSTCDKIIRRNFKSYCLHHKFMDYTNDDSKKDESLHYIDTGNKNDISLSLPPVILLLGTAQTLETYTPHISYLSKHRRLIIPELRGQGRTSLRDNKCAIDQHVLDFTQFLNKLTIRFVQQVDNYYISIINITNEITTYNKPIY